MTTKEILLDNLRNNLHPQPHAVIYVEGDKGLIEGIRTLFPHNHVTQPGDGKRTELFDYVICLSVTLPLDRINVLAKKLKDGGVLAVASKNVALLGTVRGNRGLRLSRTTDRYMYEQFKLQPVFREPIDRPNSMFGRYLPVSKWYSPTSLYIYKHSKANVLSAYKSRTSLFARLARIYERVIYKIRNHWINDYIHDLKILIKSITPFGYRLFYKHKVQKEIFKEDERKVRVAIVTGQLAAGGVERVLLQIIAQLPRSRFEVCVFSTDFNSNAWKGQFQALCTVIDIPWVLSRSKLKRFTKPFLVDSITNTSFDVVFITNSATGYRALPAIRKIYARRSQELAVYDLLHTHGRPEENDAFLRISHPYDRYINQRIVISEYLKSYFCANYPIDPKKVTVIHNSVNRLAQADARNGRIILGLRDDEKAITYIGRLQADKSPHRLISIAAALKSDLDDYQCFIAVVGDGNLRTELERKARKLGVYGKEVRFFGYQDNPLDIAEASLATILTSDLEGVPLSALESLSVGTPVIAPAVGGIPEIIDNGQNGFLASFSNPADESSKVAALSQTVLQMLITDEKSLVQMSTMSKDKIRRSFTGTESAYIQLFDPESMTV